VFGGTLGPEVTTVSLSFTVIHGGPGSLTVKDIPCNRRPDTSAAQDPAVWQLSRVLAGTTMPAAGGVASSRRVRRSSRIASNASRRNAVPCRLTCADEVSGRHRVESGRRF